MPENVQPMPEGPARAVPGKLLRSLTVWDQFTETPYTIDSGTYALHDEGGNEVIAATAGVVVDGVLMYQNASATGVVAGEVYRETWTYIINESDPFTHIQDLYVEVANFPPQVKTADMLEVLPILANYPVGQTTWASVIWSCHQRLEAALLTIGATRRQDMWTPSLWRNWSLYAAVGAALRQMSTLTGGDLLEQAREWEAKADREFERVLSGLEWDEDNDGDRDASRPPVVGMGGPSGGRTR